MFGLSVATGTGNACQLDFPGRAFVLLGRARHCDVVVAGDGVLEEHARLERATDGVVRVVALDGSRPVLVNGRAVSEAVVREGDSLRVGEVEIALRAGTPRPRARLAALGAYADAAPPPDPVRVRRIELSENTGPFGHSDLDDLSTPGEPSDAARELRTLRRVLEVNKRLARAPTEDALLDEFLDQANALCGSERAFLLALGDPAAGGAPAVLRSRDLSGATVPEPRGTLDAELAGQVLGTGRAAVSARGGPGSVLCVPLPGSEPLALYLESRSEERLFRTADLGLVTAYGEQVSVALERVRLLAENERQAAELSRAAEQAERLNRRLAELLERRTAELRDLRADLAQSGEGFRQRFPEIVGRSPAMLAVLRQVERVADTNVPVLFEGESGTGKELLARALHASSGRAAGRFVAENCAALPDSLLENELFGHERGAYTGADAAAGGLFERADGGTLFLDEVGDMSQNLQKRLLRVLQEGEVRRVGGSTVRKVDVRVVAATNRHLAELVRAGRFREDLFYRLAVVCIRVPALRERPEDVPQLVAHFLGAAGGAGPARQMSDPALDALVRHPWPGNVRQLENEIRRAAALSRGVIDLDALSAELREDRAGFAGAAGAADPAEWLAGRSLRALVDEVEARVVAAVVEREAGNLTRAARVLGTSRFGLRKKIVRLELSRALGEADEGHR
jgi:DNA-binding NtrC family response regulator